MRAKDPASSFNASQRLIVIQPIGSCEQHGPHLPIDTDLRVAQLLAERLAEKLGEDRSLLLPALPFSCSWEHKGVGTIALQVGTLSTVLHDLAKSLKTWNIALTLILVNWHGGNDLLGALATEISATEDVPTAVIPAISQVGKAWDESQITTAKEIHAGGVETSVISAFWPELISGMITDADHAEPHVAPAKAQAVMQALGIKAVTQSGIWGAPEEADPTKGKALIDSLTKRMVEQAEKIVELIGEHNKG